MNIGDNYIDILFDTKGNIYFLFDTIYYEIVIDNKNKIYLDPIELKLEDTFIKSQPLSISEKSQLKTKTKTILIEDEQIIDEDNEYNTMKYFPEELDYMDSRKKKDNTKYIFNNNTDCSIKIFKSNVKINTLFDTYIYDTNFDKKTLSFVCKSNTNDSLYILCLYTYTKLIEFRPIGSLSKTYKIDIVDNKLKIL